MVESNCAAFRRAVNRRAAGARAYYENRLRLRRAANPVASGPGTLSALACDYRCSVIYRCSENKKGCLTDIPTGVGPDNLGEEPDMETWLRHLFESGKAKFIIGQVEQGSHLHLQFYIQREESLIGEHEEEICNVTHWEPARGSAEDNIKYCSKESTRVSGPWQFGEYTTQGQRTDLDKAARMIDEGRTLREVAVSASRHLLDTTRD